MVGAIDKLLNIDAAIPKSLLGFSSGSVKALNQAAVVVSWTHAATAATGHCVAPHRVPDCLCDLQCLLLGVYRPLAAGFYRNASFPSLFPGTVLSSHSPDG